MDFPERTCNICGTQGTPVWPCGPYGLNMCNACKVRFMTSKQANPKYSRGADMPVVPMEFGPLPAGHTPAKLPGSLHPGTHSGEESTDLFVNVHDVKTVCNACGVLYMTRKQLMPWDSRGSNVPAVPRPLPREHASA